MKKIDVLIAVVVALAASLAIIWYAEPRWVSNLKRSVNEWRTPGNRSPIDLMRDERQRRRERSSAAELREPVDVATARPPQTSAETLAISIRDFETQGPVTSFRYHRILKKAPREVWENHGEWTAVSNGQGIFHIASAMAYAPVGDANRAKPDSIAENWELAIKNSIRRAWAESDTLEIQAEGYEDESVGLYSLLDGNRFDSNYVHPVYVVRIDGERARSFARTDE